MLEGHGDAIDVRVNEWYLEGFRLYEPMGGTWADVSPWTFDLSLEADETRVVLFFALTPDMTGVHVLRSEVGYLDNGAYNHVQDVELTVSVVDTLSLSYRAEFAISGLIIAPAVLEHADKALT